MHHVALHQYVLLWVVFVLRSLKICMRYHKTCNVNIIIKKKDQNWVKLKVGVWASHLLLMVKVTV